VPNTYVEHHGIQLTHTEKNYRRIVALSAWLWVNVSDGKETFVVGNREDGLHIDAFVFSTDADLTTSELDALVPEPSALLLGVAGVLGLLIFHRRRRRQ